MISKADLPTDEEIVKFSKHLFLIINSYREALIESDCRDLDGAYENLCPSTRKNIEQTIKEAVMDLTNASD